MRSRGFDDYDDRKETVTLDGYVVRAATDLAVGIAKAADSSFGRDRPLIWIPRSVCDGGGYLKRGDTDIAIEQWKADQEGLEY